MNTSQHRGERFFFSKIVLSRWSASSSRIVRCLFKREFYFQFNISRFDWNLTWRLKPEVLDVFKCKDSKSAYNPTNGISGWIMISKVSYALFIAYIFHAHLSYTWEKSVACKQVSNRVIKQMTHDSKTWFPAISTHSDAVPLGTPRFPSFSCARGDTIPPI